MDGDAFRKTSSACRGVGRAARAACATAASTRRHVDGYGRGGSTPGALSQPRALPAAQALLSSGFSTPQHPGSSRDSDPRAQAAEPALLGSEGQWQSQQSRAVEVFDDLREVCASLLGAVLKAQLCLWLDTWESSPQWDEQAPASFPGSPAGDMGLCCSS